MTPARGPGWRALARPLAPTLLAAAALAAAAAEPLPSPTPSGLGADRQDFVYLGPGGPLRLRFHLRYAGRPLSTRWGEYCDQVFGHFDADRNGSLDQKEFARFAAFPLGGGAGRVLPEPLAEEDAEPEERPTGFAEADANKDGKVTPEELRAYFRRRGWGPVVTQVLPAASDSEELTDALFKHLDVDRDGRLSRDELDAAARVLARLDLDEDEILTRQEILDRPPAATRGAVVPQERPEAPDPAGQRGDFLAPVPGAKPAATAAALIARLGKKMSAGLSRGESGFDAGRFAALDRDGNGKLDAAELAVWLGQRPDLEFAVDFGDTPASAALVVPAAAGLRVPVAVWSPEPTAPALAARVRTGVDRVLRLELPGAVLGVSPEGALNPVRSPNSNGFVLDPFRALAGDKKVVERGQLPDRPELQGLGPFFDSADGNGDGKLHLDELTAYLRLSEAGGERQALLAVSDRGRGLFELLDTDGDGRLSVRELRNAWKVLSAYASDGKQGVAREQVPHGYTFRPEMTTLSALNLGGQVFAVDLPARSPPAASRGEGPEWFRKLDRNGDGDVSPREWVGPPELFRKLDKDGDGLLSLQEAIEAQRAADASKK